MKARLAALLLSLAAGAAGATSLPRNVSLDSLQATRDQMLGQTTITGRLTNLGNATLPAPSVDFTLYDRNGYEVGRLLLRAEADLPPGAVWDIRGATPLSFVRFIPAYRGLWVADPAPVVPARKKPAAPKPAPKKPAAQAKPVEPKPVAVKPAPAPKQAAEPPSTEPSKPVLYDWGRRRPPGANGNPSKAAPAEEPPAPTAAPAVADPAKPSV